MLKSSNVLNEALSTDSDSVVLALCKVGTLASDEEGNIYQLTENALQSDAPTWAGGNIRVNHDVDEEGTISEAWYEAPYVMGRIEGLTPNTRAIMSSPAYLGVSQESQPVELGDVVKIKDHDVQEVTRVKGTGVSIMVYPYKPACQLSEGCGVPIASHEPDFNPALNTDSPKIDIEPHGGPRMDDPIVPTIEELTAKIATLEARNTDLEAQIANQPQMIETAVSNALASHEIKMKEKHELETSVAELKSCMPVGFEEFMSNNPTKAMVDGMIKGLRSANPVGAAKGANLKSEDPEPATIGAWNAETKSFGV